MLLPDGKNVDFTRIKQDGQGKIKCTISTSSPTDTPTEHPTSDPTNDPTIDPTTDPTQRPTYSPYTLTSCAVTVPARHDISDNAQVTVQFNYQTPRMVVLNHWYSLL